MPTQARLNKLNRVARQRQSGLTLIIEDVFDPHNLGAIARSCDALGVQEIHIIFETHPQFDPKEVGKNSSTATNKWLSFRVHQSTEKALTTLKSEGWQIVAAVVDPAAESVFQADLSTERLALLLGNEKDGLSQTALELADRQYHDSHARHRPEHECLGIGGAAPLRSDAATSSRAASTTICWTMKPRDARWISSSRCTNRSANATNNGARNEPEPENRDSSRHFRATIRLSCLISRHTPGTPAAHSKYLASCNA